ncbi:DUF3466 family protein [Rheinheimera sp.]|uniref:DUF3466 family protein n=1 Tax=Rheinheimera sp. TaxID=1869214 RepID=UPI0027376710|nr:DUF3466 family protein [Rheinheimera sp.]MDP2713286.1 DUF3466 family protein [Rheinheimera sp.]
MKLSRISLAILPLLSLCSVQAAVYSVVEIGEVSEVKSTYAAAINDAGSVVVNGAVSTNNPLNNLGIPNVNGNGLGAFNFPLDLDVIDFESNAVIALLTDEQLADAINGNIDASILNILLRFNPANQRIGYSLGYVSTIDGMLQNLPLRDLTQQRGNSEYLYDINNAGVAVGTASTTFALQSFTPAVTDEEPEPETVDVWVPELSHQLGVVVQNNQVSTIPAPYQELGGGFTVAKAISDSGLIAGYGSSGMDEDKQTEIEEACDGSDTPVNNCLYNDAIDGSYHKRAMVWQLQANGTIGEPEIFGFLGDKNTGVAFDGEGVNGNTYFSEANDVNNNGLAVGHSIYTDSDRNFRTEHASLYTEGQVLPLIDPLEWSSSDAVAVNNNDIIVGYAKKRINSLDRNKFFYHDYSSAQTVFPQDFFTSSASEPNAINDLDQVVGRAEVMLAGTTTRRKHGFIYDIATDSFRDLNTLLGCDVPYTIVDANDINNNGEILATALVKREQRDALGDVVLDSAGNAIEEDVVIAVKLIPVANGEAENCTTEDTVYERKGGSLPWSLLVLSSGLLWWRKTKV